MTTNTRSGYIAHLQAMLEATPSNVAIAKHLDKVKAMDDEQFAQHQRKLENIKNASKLAVRRMVKISK